MSSQHVAGSSTLISIWSANVHRVVIVIQCDLVACISGDRDKRDDGVMMREMRVATEVCFVFVV